MYYLGIDVGGTSVKFGLIEDNKLLKSNSSSTNAFDIVRQIVNGARELVQSVDLTMQDIAGIAVGFPGMVKDSIVLDSPNIGLENCKIQEILQEELGRPVIVKNDGEMATIAEHRLGAGDNCENMVLLVLGTGVGGGIIINRQLYVGKGGAGELGHVLFEKNGRKCGCGRKGCIEQYVSMIALDKLSKDTMMGYPDTTININQDGYVYASELVKAYKRNDSCAIAIIDKFVEDLSSVVMDFCNIFRPNKIVIGGGICHAPEIIDMVAKTCRRESYGYKNSPAVEIVCAKLGSNAGMLGASVCFEESDVQLENLNDLLKSDNKSEDLEENEFKGKSLLDAVIRSSEESLNNSDEAQEDSGFDNVQDDYEYHETTGGSLETQKMAEEEQTHEEVIEEELQEPEQEEEIIYDEGIIERVNALLQKKKY